MQRLIVGWVAISTVAVPLKVSAESHPQNIEETQIVQDNRVSPGNPIAFNNFSQTVQHWEQNEILLSDSPPDLGILDVAFSPDGEIVAAASPDGTVKLWDRNGNLTNIIVGKSGTIRDVAGREPKKCGKRHVKGCYLPETNGLPLLRPS